MKAGDYMAIDKEMLERNEKNMRLPTKEINFNLKAERYRNNLTQSEFAKKIGLTNVTVSKIERNVLPITKLKLEKIILISKVLNVPLNYIIGE